MRCSSCHSYIPEGLPSPVLCPQCGRVATSAATIEPKAKPAPEPANDLLPAPETDPTLTAAAPITPEAELSPDATPSSAQMAKPSTDNEIPASAASHAYAPFFTIRARLAFGPTASASVLRQPTQGSLSFGADGFSVVTDNGKHWDRISYREITAMRVHDDSVYLTVRDVDSRLTIYHRWLPDWIVGTRRRKAGVFLELLARVRGGLTAYEIALYKKNLE